MAKITEGDSGMTTLEKIYGKRTPPSDTPSFFEQLEQMSPIDPVHLPDDEEAIPWDDPAKESNVIKLPAPKVSHRVTVIEDKPKIAYPELWLNVYVPGAKWEQKQFRTMFARASCWNATSIDKADLVVFTGGPDVDPQLYGEKAHRSTRVDTARDERDIAMYNECIEKGIPMFGVCRGMQFLHVMRGGKLFQDANNHYGRHGMFDLRSKQYLLGISSSHHQVCRANPIGGMEILATSRRSTKRWLNNTDSQEGEMADIEALFYRDACILGVQGHPEYNGYAEFTRWCLQQIADLILTNPDLEWRNSSLRVKEELLKGPKKAEPETVTVPKSTRKKKDNTVCAD